MMKIITMVVATVVETITLNQTFLMMKSTTGGSSTSTSTSNFANNSLQASLPRSRHALRPSLFRPHEPPHNRLRSSSSSSPQCLRLKSLQFWRKIGVPVIDCETLKLLLYGHAEHI